MCTTRWWQSQQQDVRPVATRKGEPSKNKTPFYIQPMFIYFPFCTLTICTSLQHCVVHIWCERLFFILKLLCSFLFIIYFTCFGKCRYVSRANKAPWIELITGQVTCTVTYPENRSKGQYRLSRFHFPWANCWVREKSTKLSTFVSTRRSSPVSPPGGRHRSQHSTFTITNAWLQVDVLTPSLFSGRCPNPLSNRW